MGHLPVKLHDFSLRLMRRLMCGILLLPPRPQLQLKLFYSLSILAFIVFISRWRFSFKYNVNYDYLHDHISFWLDLFNFVALMFVHLIVAFELIWRNKSVQIDQQFRQMQLVLRERLEHIVNEKRIKFQSRIIYSIFLLRIIVLFTVTLFNYTTTQTYFLFIINFYSELCGILRCCEFALHSRLVLVIYQELNEASCRVISEMATDNRIGLQSISVLQELHQMLWRTHRDIETNFEQSLISVTMKNFVDVSIIPYWLYLTRSMENLALHSWCVTEVFGKLLEICIPCWIWTRSAYIQKKFGSYFHGVSTNRDNEELNIALLRISTQLNQERCLLRIGGLITFNHEMLGKFLFGVVSYIFICIQFRINFKEDSEVDLEAHSMLNVAETAYRIDIKQ